MFDTVLAASQPSNRSRLWKSLPLAVALHAGGIGGTLFIAYWNVDAVSEPMLSDVLYVLLPPPAAAAAAPQGPAVEPHREPATVEPQTPVQPVVDPELPIPDAPPATDPLPTAGQGDGPQIVGGDPDGSSEGVPWGVRDGNGQGLGNVVGAIDPGDDVIHLHAGMTPPRILERVTPLYSETARRARLEGIVVLEAIIDARGQVTEVEIKKPLGLGLDQRAVDAVKQWRFAPAQLNGKPVAVYFTLTVRYDLT
jgi:periplasmic protein TonB